MLAVAALFLSFTEPLVGLFSADPVVIAYGSDCLRYVSYGYGFFAVSLVLIQAFNGAGDTYTPTWINLVAFWLVQIPLAWWLAEWRAMGPQGVFAAIMLAEALVAALAYWQFQRGRWQQTAV
jgi:Na+-driven multidrug efflux pump